MKVATSLVCLIAESPTNLWAKCSGTCTTLCLLEIQHSLGYKNRFKPSSLCGTPSLLQSKYVPIHKPWFLCAVFLLLQILCTTINHGC